MIQPSVLGQDGNECESERAEDKPLAAGDPTTLRAVPGRGYSI